LVDSLKPGDLPVLACGKTGRIGPWGGLISTAASVRGATGAVMDGLVRDIREIRAMKCPVFHACIGPPDSNGRVSPAQLEVPIECGGVRVAPGDLVFSDADGCIVVPQAIEGKVIDAALERLKGERGTMAALRAGRSLGEVFAEFGVL